jgi:cytochrome c-type biogenesis protein CcmH
VSALGRRQRQAVAWAALVVVVVTAFAIGAAPGVGPRTDAERVTALSEEIACPVCQGESVAQSNAPAALNIRREIARSVDAGRTDDEIRAFLAGRYGEQQLLRPRGEGLSALVWIVPVVAVVLAAAGLVVVLRRWSRPDSAPPTDEDRQLVARFLAADDVGEVVT